MRATNTKKNRWRKTNLLACCLRLEYWQKVDSKSHHFVEKRPAVGIDIELERLRDRLPRSRPAAESQSVVRQSGAASRSRAVRAQKKWRHVTMNSPVEQELEEGARHVVKTILFAVVSTNFPSRILAHQDLGKCVLVARC